MVESGNLRVYELDLGVVLVGSLALFLRLERRNCLEHFLLFGQKGELILAGA